MPGTFHDLAADKTFRDRLYAIESGPPGFNPACPAHFPQQRLLMLMR